MAIFRKSVFLGICLVVVGVGLGLICLKAKKPRISPSPTHRVSLPTPTPKPIKANLSLYPLSSNLKVGQVFSVDIVLDTKGLEVDAADVILDYDRKLLQVQKMVPGNFFDTFPVVASEGGKIQFSGLVSPKNGKPQTVSGKGKVGTILFQTLMRGEAKVEFSPESVVAKGGENVLGETLGGRYIVR